MKLLIDFGGTHLRYIVKNSDLILKQDSFASKNVDLYDFIATILEETKGINFIGIAFAGQVKDGIILSAPNIAFTDFHIKQRLEKNFNIKVVIENDLKVASLAEINELQNTNSMVLLYIGTGFGSAYIENKKVLTGVDNLAGEIGHIPFKKAPFKCGCGKYNCLELFTSGIALKKWVEHYHLDIEPTIEALENDPSSQAHEILQNFYAGLVHASATIVTILNPQYLILGGGVCHANPQLVDFVKRSLKNQALDKSLNNLSIKLSTYKNANLIGAQYL